MPALEATRAMQPCLAFDAFILRGGLPASKLVATEGGPRPSRWMLWARIALLSLMLGCAGTLFTFTAFRRKLHGYVPRALVSPADVSSVVSMDMDLLYCGKIEDDSDLWARNLRSVGNVSGADACCAQCRRHPECRGWTWGKARGVEGLSDVCFLKRLDPGEAATLSPNNQTTSGAPFRTGKAGLASLFCFASVRWRVDGEDAQFLTAQYRHQAGIFSCEEYTVYGRHPLQLAPGVSTSVVESDSYCHQGSNPDLCMDTSAFTEVWKSVVRDGRFRFHRWTVKMELDAVFLAGHLQRFLRGIEEPPTGLYLTNCEDTLGVALQVLSRTAVQAFALGYTRCMDGMEALIFAGHLTEGKFIDRCLSDVIKVERHTRCR